MKVISAGLGLFTAFVKTETASVKPGLNGSEDFLRHELQQGFETQASITNLTINSAEKTDFDEALAPLSIFHTANK